MKKAPYWVVKIGDSYMVSVVEGGPSRSVKSCALRSDAEKYWAKEAAEDAKWACVRVYLSCSLSENRVRVVKVAPKRKEKKYEYKHVVEPVLGIGVYAPKSPEEGNGWRLMTTCCDPNERGSAMRLIHTWKRRVK